MNLKLRYVKVNGYLLPPYQCLTCRHLDMTPFFSICSTQQIMTDIPNGGCEPDWQPLTEEQLKERMGGE